MKPQAADGERTGGDVLAAIFAVLMSSMMFGQTAPGVTALGVARAAAVEVFQTTERIPPIDSSSTEGLTPQRVQGHVQFERVAFSYVSSRFTPVLPWCALGGWEMAWGMINVAMLLARKRVWLCLCGCSVAWRTVCLSLLACSCRQLFFCVVEQHNLKQTSKSFRVLRSVQTDSGILSGLM